MDIKAIIGRNKALVEKELRAAFRKHCRLQGDVLAAMRYAVFPGGKRIRPVLCLEACAACGGNARDALKAACALELIHDFSLVHDDLPQLDNDDFRRGRPSCHKKFGEAAAILAGDGLLAMAFAALAETENPKILKNIMALMAEAVGINGMIGGQGLDIRYARLAKAKVLRGRINNLKTARLFQAAAESGAMAARATAFKAEKMRYFGEIFGMAFQVRDDIKDGEYKGGDPMLSRKSLRGLIEKAKTTLDIFGDKADNLKRITDLLEVK
ncbi:MAG: polyprenyl synthetase family protein [Candidatus Omnitrophota bacterium]